jgi:hypothetical protein
MKTVFSLSLLILFANTAFAQGEATGENASPVQNSASTDEGAPANVTQVATFASVADAAEAMAEARRNLQTVQDEDFLAECTTQATTATGNCAAVPETREHQCNDHTCNYVPRNRRGECLQNPDSFVQICKDVVVEQCVEVVEVARAECTVAATTVHRQSVQTAQQAFAGSRGLYKSLNDQLNTPSSSNSSGSNSGVNVRTTILGLKFGARSEKVTVLQKLLLQNGLYLGSHGADGNFRGDTKSAVMQYQHSKQMKPSGIIDEATADALTAVPEPTGSG